MQLREFGPDEAPSVAACADIGNAARAVDAPWRHPESAFRVEMQMRYGWDGEVGRHFLVLDAGAPVGVAQLDAGEWDNLDLAWLGLTIHPDHRRRGLGTAVLARLVALSADLGRHLVGSEGWEHPTVQAFAASAGFEQKSRTVNRRMICAETDTDRVRALRDAAAAAAAAYELVRMVGRTPEDLIPAVAEMTAAINDAPTDDLDCEDEAYPPERIRAYEKASIAGGHRMYRLLARHRESGALAGHTVVQVDVDQPDQAHQHDTSVVAAHRGHRLGLLLKAEMMLWLADEEPQVASIDTWNAESNDHMIAVNEELGYQVLGRELVFQRRI